MRAGGGRRPARAVQQHEDGGGQQHYGRGRDHHCVAGVEGRLGHLRQGGRNVCRQAFGPQQRVVPAVAYGRRLRHARRHVQRLRVDAGQDRSHQRHAQGAAQFVRHLFDRGRHAGAFRRGALHDGAGGRRHGGADAHAQHGQAGHLGHERGV
ncbi:hypothetical protein G6F68_017675 [Rhizopus microsporus]|nr:hypothetical protein G6F68_017675 [Rhizopus microsporus]